MTDLNRRDAIKAFGLVGMAATLDVSLPGLERAFNAMQIAENLEPGTQNQPFTPKFFSRHEYQTLRVLVDYIIPRDARSGSATDAKVPEFMDFLLADKEASDANKVATRGGLGWLDEEARRRFDKTFVAAADADRRKILDDIAWPAKAPAGMTHGVAFFTRMRDFTASGFFSSQMGWKDLQYIGNVSLPAWNGCPQPALDKLGVSYDLMNSKTGTK